jgi:hypothetical protein
MDLIAKDKSQKLTTIDRSVKREGQNLVKPTVDLSPMAQAHSNNPAMTKYVHAIDVLQSLDPTSQSAISNPIDGDSDRAHHF